jgi:hypothetical protein
MLIVLTLMALLAEPRKQSRLLQGIIGGKVASGEMGIGSGTRKGTIFGE